MGEPGRWRPFDRLHLQSHSKVAQQSRRRAQQSHKRLHSPSQEMNSQDQRWQRGVNAGWRFTVQRSMLRSWKPLFLSPRRYVSPLPLSTAVFTRQNDLGQVFFQGHSGSSEGKRGFSRSGGAARSFFRRHRQQSVRESSRDMFKSPSSPPTSRRRRSNSAHTGRQSERETPRPRLITSVKLEILSA